MKKIAIYLIIIGVIVLLLMRGKAKQEPVSPVGPE